MTATTTATTCFDSSRKRFFFFFPPRRLLQPWMCGNVPSLVSDGAMCFLLLLSAESVQSIPLNGCQSCCWFFPPFLFWSGLVAFPKVMLLLLLVLLLCSVFVHLENVFKWSTGRLGRRSKTATPPDQWSSSPWSSSWTWSANTNNNNNSDYDISRYNRSVCFLPLKL